MKSWVQRLWKEKLGLPKSIFYLGLLGLLLGSLFFGVKAIEHTNLNKTAVYSAALHYLFQDPTNGLGFSAWQTIYITPRETAVKYFPSYTKAEGDYLPGDLLNAVADLAPHILFADHTAVVTVTPGQMFQMPPGTISVTLGPIDRQLDGTVEVDVDYYLSMVGGAGYEVYLAYNGQDWTVQSTKMPWIS